MKFLKWLLIIIAVLAVILVVVGFLLPQTRHVERSITVAATKDTVFNQVNNLKNFNNWSPWSDIDPNASYSFTGPQSGVGATMAWDSQMKEVGSGTYKIVESNYPNLVKFEMKFGQEQTPAESSFILEEISYAETRVTWTLDADFGNDLIGRYMGFFLMEKAIGPQYEKGLDNLKDVVEG
ncbi:MAG TPA: SRPBCC family protein [Kangiella sp.]